MKYILIFSKIPEPFSEAKSQVREFFGVFWGVFQGSAPAPGILTKKLRFFDFLALDTMSR